MLARQVRGRGGGGRGRGAHRAQGPLTRSASKRVGAPPARLPPTAPSPRTCAFAAAGPTRRCLARGFPTRAAHPGPGPSTRLYTGWQTPVAAPWRVPARWPAARRFLRSRHRFPGEGSLWASRPRARGLGRRGPPGPAGTGSGPAPVPSGAGAGRSAELRPPGGAQPGRQQDGPPPPRARARPAARLGGPRAPGAAAGAGAAVITWPAWSSPSPGGRAGGRGAS